MSAPYVGPPRTVILGSVGQSQSIRVSQGIQHNSDGLAWFAAIKTWLVRAHGVVIEIPNVGSAGKPGDNRNWGVGGSGVSTPVAAADSWQPGAASGYRAAALTGLAAAGVTHCEVTFGTEDANVGATAQHYHDGLKSLVDAIVALGIKCMVNHCPNTQSSPRDTVSAGWDSYIVAEVDNVNVFEGVNFYSAILMNGVGATFGWWDDSDQSHQNLAGNWFFARRLIGRYHQTGWLLK